MIQGASLFLSCNLSCSNEHIAFPFIVSQYSILTFLLSNFFFCNFLWSFLPLKFFPTQSCICSSFICWFHYCCKWLGACVVLPSYHREQPRCPLSFAAHCYLQSVSHEHNDKHTQTHNDLHTHMHTHNSPVEHTDAETEICRHLCSQTHATCSSYEHRYLEHSHICLHINCLNQTQMPPACITALCPFRPYQSSLLTFFISFLSSCCKFIQIYENLLSSVFYQVYLYSYNSVLHVKICHFIWWVCAYLSSSTYSAVWH